MQAAWVGGLAWADAQPGDDGLQLRGRLHSPQGELPSVCPYYGSWLLDWTFGGRGDTG